MNNNLIVMLTNNDVTVENALRLFEKLKDLPVQYWGFKDVGLAPEQMTELVGLMKAAGKTTFLEVVKYTEDEGLKAAELALECSVDYLTGTIFCDSILQFVKDEDMKYYPFFGDIHGHPVVLDGEVDDILRHGQELVDKGVDGLDLVAYRYGNEEDTGYLISRCVAELTVPLILAGSINSWTRLEETKSYGLWAFTIGSAFFDRKFASDGSVSEQIMAVWNTP